MILVLIICYIAQETAIRQEGEGQDQEDPRRAGVAGVAERALPGHVR